MGRRKKGKKTGWEEQRTDPELGEQTAHLPGLIKSMPVTNGEVWSEQSKELRVPLPYGLLGSCWLSIRRMKVETQASGVWQTFQ